MDNVDCNSVLEQLSDYIDSDAREELCQAIAEHMSRCHDCRIYVDSVRKTIILYQNGTPAELPVQVTDRLQVALAREYASGRGPARAD